MPSLLTYNCFDVLAIEQSNETIETVETAMQILESPPPSLPLLPRYPASRPKWEKPLPSKFIIAATEGNPTSLKLKIELETTDTVEVKSANVLVDCGATGEFIDRHYAKSCGFHLLKLSKPIPVYNIDGTPNEAGSVTEVVDLILRYKNHSERTLLAVSSLGKQKLILRHSWLHKHNPEINWATGEVKMSRCPPRCCAGCRQEACQEHISQKAQIRQKESCSSGPTPEFHHDAEDVEDAEDSLDQGDRIFATGIFPPRPQEEIRASSTISTRLAEAFKVNSEATLPSIPDYLHEFKDVFSKKSFDVLPKHKDWDHAIELIPGEKAASCKVYPLAPSEQKELDLFLKENLETGQIRPSKSPMSSPVFFIKKKDGSLRLVQDYQALNAITVKNKYLLPLISELINKLQGARYFTKLDVGWGFNNVRMKDGDEWKAAFRTNRGLFEPLVMFFGLTNSPATFQTMMNDLLPDLIDQGVVIVYMDDILVFNKTLEEHRQTVCRVLEIIAENELYLKPKKCEFEKSRIDYLGLIISAGQVEMDPTKVRGVADWPKPKTVKEVQSFLGFINFYRRFIHDFARVARPLHELTRKTVVWNWTSKEQAAFEELKGLVMSTPILVFPREDKPFLLEADASDFATGAVLSQEGSDGKLHPVGYMSQSLSAVERNYEIHDKEMLAIMLGLEEWRHFLEGAKCKFEIITDHKNLEYFRSAQKLNRRQARWSLYLSRFDFTLTHKPGKTMLKVDSLSRRADHGRGHLDNADIVLLQPELFRIRALEATVSDVRALGDKFLVRIRETEDRDEAVVKAVKELRASARSGLRNAEWEEEDGIVLF